MTETIRWGILGTGFIAGQFATGLSVIPEAELVAVGSRTEESANRFGDEYDVPRRHGSYGALASDPDVDVIYIATPHPMHKDDCLLCLETDKAVLCEKPFTINAAEAKSVIQTARARKLFLMEAMWTRFIPAVIKLRELLAEEVLGRVHTMVGDLGFSQTFDPQSRLFAPELGGGALLDIGVYPISFASMLFGPPAKITSTAQLGQTGVDEQSAYVLEYEQGQLAVLYATIRAYSPSEVTLSGEKGRLRVHAPMYRPSRLTLSLVDQEEQVIELPLEGNGYNYQAIEVMNCLRSGKLESETMPLDETLAIMQTMDQIRAQWGLKYPTE